MDDVATVSFTLNGKKRRVTGLPDTPLLWILREDLKLTGTKFGCGVGQCGACTVHINGSPTFGCLFPLSALEGLDVTTIEGLSSDASHPLQKAWLAENVPQCGYCQSGQIMRAAGLLKETPQPSRQQIVDYMSTNLCRCGTYERIALAIERAAAGATP
jgi:isoquinoline 1-oxidoreductase subunit alpha